MEQGLQKLVNLMSSKFSTSFTFQSKESEFKINFPTPIELNNDLNYELGLLWFSCYNSICNINNSNNKFQLNDKIITISPGAYEVKDLNEKLKIYKLEIILDMSTAKCTLILPKDLILIIENTSFFHTMLGFQPGLYNKEGKYSSQNKVDIIDISTINITCDLIKGSYANGVERNILYSFPINTVPFGYKIIERMSNPIYIPITRKLIESIKISIVDENDKLIDFNGETINLYLHLKQV